MLDTPIIDYKHPQNYHVAWCSMMQHDPTQCSTNKMFWMFWMFGSWMPSNGNWWKASTKLHQALHDHTCQWPMQKKPTSSLQTLGNSWEFSVFIQWLFVAVCPHVSTCRSMATENATSVASLSVHAFNQFSLIGSPWMALNHCMKCHHESTFTEDIKNNALCLHSSAMLHKPRASCRGAKSSGGQRQAKANQKQGDTFHWHLHAQAVAGVMKF